jgi:ADP-ribose pyrophosphatase YjhB (NUDIX family)
MNSISTNINKFNLRVYGIYIREDQLLLSDEFRFGKIMTKLPGGGLELGEGIEEGLRREWMEELQTEIEVNQVVYVNPYFQVSVFDPSHQVICMYFRITPKEALQVPVSQQPYNFPLNGEDQQSFRWKEIDQLIPSDFTFPADQSLVPVLKNLKNSYC